MLEKIKRGRGRPKQSIRKDIQFNIRLNMGEEAMLQQLSKEMGVSKSGVILRALKHLYKETR